MHDDENDHNSLTYTCHMTFLKWYYLHKCSVFDVTGSNKHYIKSYKDINLIKL